MNQKVLRTIEKLPSVIRDYEPSHLFVVADRAAYDASGARSRLADLTAKYPTTFFCDFEPNPQVEAAEVGARCMPSELRTAVVAVGGGSAIDMAKLICFQPQMATSTGDWWLGGGTHRQRAALLVAVPTTAGTGSEATQFAVVYSAGKKYSLSDSGLLPDVSVLDASLTESMPPNVTAASGLDAISQAIESLWSKGATAESRADARRALQLAVPNLVTSVETPTLDARRTMLEAAHLSGRAINITRTTSAHALSYKLTSDYGLLHGFAVALCMLGLLRHQAAIASREGSHESPISAMQECARLVLEGLGVSVADTASVADFAKRWESLLERVDCPTSLAAVGVQDSEAIEQVAYSVNAQRLANHPVEMSHQSLVEALKTIA